MKKIALISDIHIGHPANPPDKYFTQLNEIFFKPMEDFKPDIIFDLGDTTHTKLFLHSDDASLFLLYGQKIKSLAKDVLIVFGTYSHLFECYKAYNHLIDEHFRIIYRAENLLFSDLNLLILPEEYDKNDSYYEKFFNLNNKYDFILGHGMFAHIGYYIKDLTNIIQSKHAKVWNYKQFENLFYGGCYFGHIHQNSEYHDIIYPGSFSRTCFGEEQDKGYYILEYDEIKKKIIKKEFIKNYLAPTYKDIYIKELPTTNLDDLLKTLRKHSEENYKIRIIINENITDEVLNNIIAFSKNHNNTSILKKMPKNLTEKEEKEKEKRETINSEIEKYKDKDFFAITKEIAKEKYNMDFSIDEINNILNN